MKKILSIIPLNIAGTIIVRGFNSGFKSNGCYIMEKDVRELTPQIIARFKPDVIFGYDYSYLQSTFLTDYILENKDKFKLVHYFGDEPESTYAYGDYPDLYKKFRNIDAYSFVWDKDFVSQLPNAQYLPLGANYKVYKVEDFGDFRYDISFVGRPLTDKRQEILCRLIKVFGNRLSIFSYENYFLRSLNEITEKGLLNDEELEIYKNSYKGYLKTEQDLADVYSRSKINVNITLQGKTSLNYRVFEVPASRGFLLTDDVADLHENFEIGREVESYKNIDDLIDKIKFYLDNPNIAEKIVYNGFAAVYKRHSYTARARSILQSIKN